MARPLDRTESSVARSSVESAVALDIAARSMLESRAVGGTIASVVADRALDHHWEGLFQYAAIRLGGQRALEQLELLEQVIEAAPSDALDAAPSPRSHLYARIRAQLRETARTPLAVDAPAWWRPLDSTFRDRLLELRRALPAGHAEVAELRFTRRLSASEVAHVLGITLDEVEAASQEAVASAERICGRRPASRDPRPEGALLEAFALDPRQLRAPRRRLRRPVLRMGAVIADRYEVEELLGAGAFADVYRARDREVTDHVVALKILRTPPADARAVRAAMRELQLIASVFHPSVVQLKDHGWHDGHLWFVMPLYRGETLATRLRRGPLGRKEAREIFEPLAEALATMHRAGVLHQDVKPENVFLANIDPDPDLDTDAANSPRRILPVLLDLGVAAKDAELVLAGTPAYFAPEVAARFAGAPDPAPVGPKADVFSLALTLRQALEPNPTEDVAGGAVDAFITFRATRPAAIPKRRDLRDLRPYFERWLNFSPDARPSADEFRRELQALTRPAEKAARRWALMRWVVPTAIGLLALFSASIYVLSREASLQRVEAIHARERAKEARQRAASISASLSVQQERRRQLEADVQRLEQEYQTSRMTREQLASRLAQTEGELEVFADRQQQQLQKNKQQTDEIRVLRDERSALGAEIAGLRDKRTELNTKIDRLEATLEAERARRVANDATANELREHVRSAEFELERARARIGELETRIAVLRQAWAAPTPGRQATNERARRP